MNNCGNCAVHNKDNSCGLNGQFGWENEDYCSKWINEIERCDMCHSPILPQNSIWDNGLGKLLCPNCLQQLNTCFSCMHECLIDKDKSGQPKMVQQTIQQGNMTFMTQVLNPKLVEEYCEKCICSNGGRCQRENNYCNNYKMKGR